MKPNIEVLELSKQMFKHKWSSLVQFSDVDSFRVVHNLRYLYWIEWARTAYLKDIGLDFHRDTFVKENALMTVRTEVNYLGSLYFNDKFDVLTRVESIGNSSFVFENMICNDKGGIIVHCKAWWTNVNVESNRPETINDSLKNMIRKFESNNLIEKNG